jgi:3-methyladenine DNA glycosylase AlkD
VRADIIDRVEYVAYLENGEIKRVYLIMPPFPRYEIFCITQESVRDVVDCKSGTHNANCMVEQIRRSLKAAQNPVKAKILQRFFKTGEGEYGEGDIFLGITVPEIRFFVKKYSGLSTDESLRLLKSNIHEERTLAVLLLVDLYQKGDEGMKKKVFDVYMKNTKFINNWDLVDCSADRIVGDYLENKSKEPIIVFAKSKDLWKKRISIIATFDYIKKRKYEDTLMIAEILLHDEHDLIHKAVGWMLREVGKRVSPGAEEQFLRKHAHEMPRTMLRYAIERFPEEKRRFYLSMR